MDFVDTYEPIRTLKPVADNIWIVDGPIEYMQQYGIDVPFPTRMTIIRLSNGDLFVHSPVQGSDKLYRQIEKLGRVAHLVSPNKIHYASIYPWSQRFPDALCWASPGVRQRAKSRNITVRFDRDLRDGAEDEWLGEIDQLYFRGGRFMDEVVFFHKSSKTVILADLIENFEKDKVRWWIVRVLKLTGVLAPDGMIPVDLRMTFIGRHKIACQCFDKMMAWNADKIILSHGRWFDQDGSRELKHAFRWLKC
ncbi:MAG TPA: DUF4336 domain-containing protein [Rhizobiales bacterium]|nr:DUF4336 domain-containing protein [Hyphomicrobiales bacterium]